MIHAIGFSVTSFDPSNPGRLCRGRERWIDGFPLESSPQLHRVVVSGARFTDDTARDARRGLRFSGISAGLVLDALVNGSPLLAFCEQGHPLAVPDHCILTEHYLQPRQGGQRMDPCVRWRLALQGWEAIDPHISLQPQAADGFVPWKGALDDDLEEALFLLTGYGERLDFPVQRFQPTALPQLLEHVPFVVCIHLDKHAPALGIYSREPLPVAQAISQLAQAHGALAVPFSIPPMLARWDRALFELRMSWRRGGNQEFPVPPGESGAALRREAAREE